MSDTPIMSTSGRTGLAARYAPEAPVTLDRWAFMSAGGTHEFDYSVTLVDPLAADGVSNGELQLCIARMTEGVPPPALAMMSMGQDREQAREVTRHLMRQAAHGQIPMPPVAHDDRRIWEAAASINASFVERWGTLEDAERERRTKR